MEKTYDLSMLISLLETAVIKGNSRGKLRHPDYKPWQYRAHVPGSVHVPGRKREVK